MRLFSEIYHLDTGALQELYAIRQTVFLTIDDSFEPSLYDEFGTLDAGRSRDVDGGTVRVVRTACQFGDGIGFSV
jgi:hypothetical protein